MNIVRVFLSDIEFLGGKYEWIEDGKRAKIFLGKIFHVKVIRVRKEYLIFRIEEGFEDFYEMYDYYMEASNEERGFYLFYRELCYTGTSILQVLSTIVSFCLLHKIVGQTDILHFFLIIPCVIFVIFSWWLKGKALKMDGDYFLKNEESLKMVVNRKQ